MRKLHKFIFILFALICIAQTLSADDGPYVFWENSVPVTVTIYDSLVFRDTLIANDDGDYFLDWSNGIADPVLLKHDFAQPPTSLPKPDKFLAISDVHGNIGGMVELFLASGIMDENYNWIYDGNLIVLGDVLDRGEYTTECLWLLYSLYMQSVDNEHNKLIPVLGNHENMTLADKTHKMKGKYGRTCDLLDMTYNELYGENTLLGRWIRSWQSLLKMDDLLFVHGGISPGFAQRYNDLNIVNDLIWNYYHGRVDLPQTDLDYLLRTNGPFWYRGYFYSEEKWETVNPAIIDGILNEYNLKNIIVGHTTFDNIHYAQEGRIIAIDAGLKHQESGQALLYQNNDFFILASDGTVSHLDH